MWKKQRKPWDRCWKEGPQGELYLGLEPAPQEQDLDGRRKGFLQTRSPHTCVLAHVEKALTQAEESEGLS